jgi:tetratricopeptide (TPR) repeat protein
MYIFLYFLIIPGTVSASDTIVNKCRAALQVDLTDHESRQSVISLIEKIEDQENLYLKSALYPDVRRYYEKILVKLGNFFFDRKDFQNAGECYVKADKYSPLGYKDKIDACEEEINKNRKLRYWLGRGISCYDKGEYKEAEKNFKRVLERNLHERVANNYLEKIGEWKKIPVITPKTASQFMKNHQYSIILSELKRKLYKKYPYLPPENYLDYLVEQNPQGYWEARLNGHLMVYIPGKPQGTCGFFVDKYEVSFAQLETLDEFKEKRKKSTIPLISILTGDYPAVVTFKEAEVYCNKKGFRLPTKKEWEMAAGKEYGYPYPWGKQPVDAGGVYRANYDDSIYIRDGFETVAPVKSFEKYTSPHGLVNLSGNVWEWVQGEMCKGGGFMSEKEDLKITSTSKDEAWVGFRCVKAVKK